MALDGPDVVVLAPQAELLANPIKERAVAPFGKLYAEEPGLIVRTALIRAAGYSPRKAPKIERLDVPMLAAHLVDLDQEHVLVVTTNRAHKLLAIHENAIGGTSGAALEAKHVVKIALLTDADHVYILHNHPGGDPSPSTDDLVLTAAVAKALKCAGRRLDDHFILAYGGYYSFQDAGNLS
jgi:DNA repair protein RadC